MNEPVTAEEAKDSVLETIQWTPHTARQQVMALGRGYHIDLRAYEIKAVRRKTEVVLTFTVIVTDAADATGTWSKVTLVAFRDALQAKGWRVTMRKRANAARLQMEFLYRVVIV